MLCAGLSLRSQELTALFLAVRLFCRYAIIMQVYILHQHSPSVQMKRILSSAGFDCGVEGLWRWNAIMCW